MHSPNLPNRCNEFYTNVVSNRNMVDVSESIKVFKENFLVQGIKLTEMFNKLVNESIRSIHYTRNYVGEQPIIIEGNKCHHVPYNGISIDFVSGRRVLIFDSNDFSKYGGTYGINIRELKTDELIKDQIAHSDDSNWVGLRKSRITSVQVLWLDDDGWESPKLVNGINRMIPDEKSQGIFPHGVELTFANKEQIYILAVEPDIYLETEKRYKYLRGGEEFVIAFNKQVAVQQKLIIEGLDLGLE